MVDINKLIKGCEHDGSYVPISEVRRLMEIAIRKAQDEIFDTFDKYACIKNDVWYKELKSKQHPIPPVKEQLP